MNHDIAIKVYYKVILTGKECQHLFELAGVWSITMWHILTTEKQWICEPAVVNSLTHKYRKVKLLVYMCHM